MRSSRRPISGLTLSTSPPTGENPGRPWGAGRGIVPEGLVAHGFLHYSRVVNGGDDAHGVLAHGAAQQVHTPDPRNQVADGEMGLWGAAVCNTNEMILHSACFVLTSPLVVRVCSSCKT
jgi:hypothetical protein